MNKAVNAVLWLIGPVALSGCLATTQTANDMQEMKRRLAAVEQVTVARRGEAQDDRLAELGRRLADIQAEQAALRVDFQRLSGQYEDSGHESERIREQLELLRKEIELRLDGFEQRLAAADKAPAPPPAAPETSGEASYEKGLQLIQKENRFTEGRKELQAFLKAQPQHDLAVNAMYWIGEAYYGEKQYEKAILQFQDVIQKFAKHAKAPAAMLKQALAFEALGDKETAKARLKQVLASYPSSPEAAKAKERLK